MYYRRLLSAYCPYSAEGVGIYLVAFPMNEDTVEFVVELSAAEAMMATKDRAIGVGNIISAAVKSIRVEVKYGVFDHILLPCLYSQRPRRESQARGPEKPNLARISQLSRTFIPLDGQ